MFKMKKILIEGLQCTEEASKENYIEIAKDLLELAIQDKKLTLSDVKELLNVFSRSHYKSDPFSSLGQFEREFFKEAYLSIPSGDFNRHNLYLKKFGSLAQNFSVKQSRNSRDVAFILSGLPFQKNGSHIKLLGNYIDGVASSEYIENLYIIFTMERALEDFYSIDIKKSNLENRLKLQQDTLKTKFRRSDKVSFFHPSMEAIQSKNVLAECLDFLNDRSPSICFNPMGIISSNLLKPFCQELINVYLPFNVNNQPDDFCDIFVCLDEERVKRPKNNKMTALTYQMQWPVNREDFIESKKYEEKKPSRAITVLGNGRLNGVFENLDNDQFKMFFNSCFKRFKKLLIVGDVADDWQSRIIALSVDKGCSVEFLAYSDSLPTLYQDYEVFLEVPGANGGGYGALAAIFADLLVFARKGTDIASYVTSDCTYSSIEELFFKVDAIQKCSLKFKAMRESNLFKVSHTLSSQKLMGDLLKFIECNKEQFFDN